MSNLLADDQDRLEEELVIKCQQGDYLSFRQLYQRYQQRVRATLYQLCGEQLLDDLMQEVFFKVWKGLPKLRQPQYFSTWLYRITTNVATDARRKLAKYKQEWDILSQNAQENPDKSHLMHLHYQDLVHKGLQNLTLEHRLVLVLHDLEGLAQKEVAQILGIPLGTVKSRLFNARKSMRQFLEQQGVSL